MKRLKHLLTPEAAVGIAIVLTVMVMARLGGRATPASHEAMGSDSAGPVEKPAEQRLLEEAYSQIPLGFEANRGQVDPRVQFLSQGAGYTLYLTEGEAVLALRRGENARSTVRMKVVGARADARAAAGEEQHGKVHYLKSSDPSRWRTDVPRYGRIRYTEVYPGIDLVYYGSHQGQLEYDFIVAPGADPRTIRLGFEGAALSLKESGDLILDVSRGELRQKKPVVYQEKDGRRVEVAGRFALEKNGEVSFELGDYDRSAPLVIDPMLVYSTYLGGSRDDLGLSIAVDSQGSAYVTGFTYSASDFPTGKPFPTTAKAFQPQPAGEGDAFVTKFSPNGRSLVYSTYLGGRSSDWGQGITVDAAGRAHVTGRTHSGDFPVLAASQPKHGGSCWPNDSDESWYCTNSDAFVTVLGPGGASLITSSFLGGQGDDEGTSISVNQSRVYVTGQTRSVDFPSTQGRLNGGRNNEPAWYAESDAFVTLFDRRGARIHSMFLGGSASDRGNAVVVDRLGAAYVTGVTASTSEFGTTKPFLPFPTTAGSLMPVASPSADNRLDGFVTKVVARPKGLGLSYSTFLGGAQTDEGQGIAVDAFGNAYVVGSTLSPDFPATAGAFRSRCTIGPEGYCVDAFVSKLNREGSLLVYSTFLGGTGTDRASSVFVSRNIAYVVGDTSSKDFPLRGGALYDARSGFLAKLNQAGSDLLFSSYLGGRKGFQALKGVAADDAANMYVVGHTTADDFPTARAFQSRISETNSPYGPSAEPVVAKVSTTLNDYTPRIEYWYGKVNQHVENGVWMTDTKNPYAGANIDKLAYCQFWYPNTSWVEPYHLETIFDWKAAGNRGSYVGTFMSHRCVDQTARVAFLPGKVNQFSQRGNWYSDPDGAQTLDPLTYCKKWFPYTIGVHEYRIETIFDWKSPDTGGGAGSHTANVMSHQCIQSQP